MRMMAILLSLAARVAFADSSFYQEFAGGFGGIRWGTDLSEIVSNFPGGYEHFSTSPGGINYELNNDDTVLGISRSGQYVEFGIGADGKVGGIFIQVAYDQTSALISAVKSKLGPPTKLEVDGFVTTYWWPPDQGMSVAVRTTSNLTYGLTGLAIVRQTQSATQKPAGRKSN
jgi:hypothetical protein